MKNQALDRYLETHLQESVAELARLCAQPSVSAQNWGMAECADLVAGMLRRRGFSVAILPTGASPVVFAERAGRGERTLLFYNHYDVQPPEPLELWDTPPFEPALRDGKLYARGVNDDKGHIVSRLFAIDALLAVLGELPCRVKFLIEGDEETSSEHLVRFVRENQARLAADACVWEFGGVDDHGAPLQYLGLRGIQYVELSIETANQDVHSGLGGSIFPNAAWRLTWALNSLKGPDERIRIPGFYDRVIPPTPRDLELLAALPETAGQYRERYGLRQFVRGLTGGVALRAAEVFEPTCTICGLTSGYQGEGAKTVLPARASAKIDFRLVPDQDPQEIVRLLRAHLDEQGFADVQITDLGGDAPGRTDPDHPFIRQVVEAARSAYDELMRLVPITGGSGPIAPFLHDLRLPVATAGVSYPGAQIHAPNENLPLDLYLRGAQHIAYILQAFGQG